MLGVGVSEFIVIIIVGLLLFGTPLLTFLLGYTLGKRTTPGADDTTLESDDATRRDADRSAELADVEATEAQGQTKDAGE